MTRIRSKGDTHIVQGCALAIIALVVGTAVCILSALVPSVKAEPVTAPTATLVVCQPIGQAALSTPYSSVNIRPSPIAIGTPLGAVNDRTPRAIKATVIGWLGLCPEGWVAAQYFTVTYNTATPSPKAPTVKPPTQIPPPTSGPSPTARRNVWVEFSDGTLWQCDLPCHFTIYDTLPER